MPDKPLGLPPAGPTRGPAGGKDKFTKLICPNCGARTGVELGEGDSRTYCFNCHALITVSIRVERINGEEQSKAG